MSSSIVLIAPAPVIAALRERLSSGAELRTFPDTDSAHAIEYIVRYRPRIIAVEHEFSGTSRGMALVDRIKDDPELSGCELRIIAHDGASNRMTARRVMPSSRAVAATTTVSGDTVTTAAAAEAPRPLDPQGTRREPRIEMRPGIEVLIDGNPATLQQLSVIGAMVLSPRALKPNQRVRLAFTDGERILRCNASVVWATFEMPKGQPPAYRAGLEMRLSAADSAAIGDFAARNKAD